MSRPLFVCYVPGVDRRRVDASRTPHVHRLLQTFPSVTIDTYPSTELLAALITGVYPGEHRVWQASVKPHVPDTAMTRLLDRVPDAVTAAVQCAANFFCREMELAAVPYRRRRRFDLHRFKYTRRAKEQTHALAQLNGVPTIFSMVETSGYQFGKSFDRLDRIAATLPTPGLALEWLEYYAFDMFSHWNLDRPDAIDAAVRRTDAAIARLHEQCDRRSVTFVLLVDHGQELIRRRIDLRDVLRHSGVPRDEYTYLMEVAVTRLWFFTERARKQLTAALADVAGVTLVPHDRMGQYHVELDASFGELYVYADHGCAFFPHDFYEPLANLYLGLATPGLRARVRNPRHRGNHGHLPNHPSEQGYMVVADGAWSATAEVAPIIDVAPTLLGLMGREPGPRMRGKAVFATTQGSPCGV